MRQSTGYSRTARIPFRLCDAQTGTITIGRFAQTCRLTLFLGEHVLGAASVMLPCRKDFAAFRDIAGFLLDARPLECQSSLLSGFRSSSPCSDTTGTIVIDIGSLLYLRIVLHILPRLLRLRFVDRCQQRPWCIAQAHGPSDTLLTCP
jgi:hypothetical protein